MLLTVSATKLVDADFRASVFSPPPPTSEWEIPNFDELDPFNPFTRFSILLISLALGLEARTAEVVFSIWLFW